MTDETEVAVSVAAEISNRGGHQKRTDVLGVQESQARKIADICAVERKERERVDLAYCGSGDVRVIVRHDAHAHAAVECIDECLPDREDLLLAELRRCAAIGLQASGPAVPAGSAYVHILGSVLIKSQANVPRCRAPTDPNEPSLHLDRMVGREKGGHGQVYVLLRQRLILGCVDRVLLFQ